MISVMRYVWENRGSGQRIERDIPDPPRPARKWRLVRKYETDIPAAPPMLVAREEIKARKTTARKAAKAGQPRAPRKSTAKPKGGDA